MDEKSPILPVAAAFKLRRELPLAITKNSELYFFPVLT